MGIRDFLPRHHSELLLKYDEFVDAWLEVLEAAEVDACAREAVLDAVRDDAPRASRLVATVRVVLLVIAMRAWRAKPRMRDAVREKVERSVVCGFLGGANGEGLGVEEAWDVYRANLDFFDRMFQGDGQEGERRYARCALMAKYVADTCLEQGDPSCDEAVQQLAISLAACAAACERLAMSSVVDGNTMYSGKPRFIVLQR